MKKSLSLILIVSIFAGVALVGCGAKEDDASNVVVKPEPKDAPIKPVPLGGGGPPGSPSNPGTAKSNPGELPPP